MDEVRLFFISRSSSRWHTRAWILANSCVATVDTVGAGDEGAIQERARASAIEMLGASCM